MSLIQINPVQKVETKPKVAKLFRWFAKTIEVSCSFSGIESQSHTFADKNSFHCLFSYSESRFWLQKISRVSPGRGGTEELVLAPLEPCFDIQSKLERFYCEFEMNSTVSFCGLVTRYLETTDRYQACIVITLQPNDSLCLCQKTVDYDVGTKSTFLTNHFLSCSLKYETSLQPFLRLYQKLIYTLHDLLLLFIRKVGIFIKSSSSIMKFHK